MKICDLSRIPSIIEDYKFNIIGDVLEFGTCTCQSAIQLANMYPYKTVFTIDHFQGLEKTSKPLPTTSDWREGAFGLGGWSTKGNDAFPKTIEEALERLSTKPNIKPIISDIHKLTHPSDYGINKIAICNVDVDIYEPTVSSLEFLSKCEWTEVFIRFDDWHGNESEYDEHERLAFKEWIEKYNYQYEITHGGYIGGVYVKR